MKRGLKEWDASYIEQENEIRNNMEDGEEYVRCLDTDSFNGTCYDPSKVITNYGRVWSLAKKGFIKGGGNNHDYLRITLAEAAGEYNHAKYATIHKLVANYFCDKQIIKIMETINGRYSDPLFDLSLDANGNYKIIQIHHIDSDNKNNRADNLQYIYTELHEILTALRNSDNENEAARKRYSNILHELNLDDGNDPYLKLMYDNAVMSGSRLYGYIVRDDTAELGYRWNIILSTTIPGTPENTAEEPDDFELEYMKMRAKTMGKPDYIG